MRNHISRFSAAAAVALVLAASIAHDVAVEPVRAQGGPNCVVLLNKTGAIAPMAGGAFTVTVFPDPPNCNFQVSVLTPGGGTITKGPGNIANVTVAANPAGSPAREVRFQIGDQVFRVVQAGENAVTPWNIGDVFVGAGSDVDSSGVYKTLGPQGSPKLDTGSANPVADLLDGAGYYTNGCMVDPTVPDGHLFTAAWTANTLSIFDSGTHQLRDVFRFSDPSALHPNWGVPFNTPLADFPRAAGVAQLPSVAIFGRPDDPSTPEDDSAPPEIQGFEQVVFARNGEFYVGTQTPPENNDFGLGHAYLLRFRYDPFVADSNKLTLTGWWLLDTGGIDANRPDGSSAGASGVDQFDLSSDQETIFYTSEDRFIRYFNVVTGTPGAMELKNTDGNPLFVRAYGIRILPGPVDVNGVPPGFLVATSNNFYSNVVVRVDATGKAVKRYDVPGQPFALNLTPDAQYFWTADQASGVVYRFHIASGAREQFDPGTNAVFGLCVKREYSAATADEQCPVLNEDGSYSLGTSACRTPPVCTAPGIDSEGNQNADCFPPGLNRPVFDNQENREGDQVALDISRPGFIVTLSGLAPTWGLSVTPDGLVTGTIKPEACVPGDGENAALPKRCDFTLTVNWTLASDPHATPRESSFTWTIIHVNAAPVLRNPGPITLTPGQVLDATVSCPDAPAMALIECATTPIVYDPDVATDHVYVFTTGLPPALYLPSSTWYGSGWDLPLTGTAPTTIGPELGKFNVTITVCDDTGLLRNPLGTPFACDLGSNHTSSESFLIKINAPPTLVSAAQLTQVPLVTSDTYQLLAEDANGDPLTYELVAPTSLPSWLNWNAATNTFTATPTLANAGAFIEQITVRVIDTLGADATTTFSWRVNAAPVLAIPSLTFLVDRTTSHPINATDSAGDTLTYTLDSIAYSGGSTQWVSWDGTLRTLTAAPTPADAGSSATITLRVSDQWGGTTTVTAVWFATANNAPVCSAATASPGMIWPPNHKLVPISIRNVTDPDGDPLTILITSITQDQPVNDKGDGNTGSDATGVGTSTAAVRAERTGHLRVPGDGRLYQVNFTASDGKGGSCGGTVVVGVPHDRGQRSLPTDNGCRWDSVTGEQLGPCAWLNAPVLALPNRTDVEGTAINLQVTATDADGTPLTYSATSLPPGLSMSPSGLITGTIAPGAAGGKSKKYKVTVSASDSYNTVTANFTWTVTRP